MRYIHMVSIVVVGLIWLWDRVRLLHRNILNCWGCFLIRLPIDMGIWTVHSFFDTIDVLTIKFNRLSFVIWGSIVRAHRLLFQDEFYFWCRWCTNHRRRIHRIQQRLSSSQIHLFGNWDQSCIRYICDTISLLRWISAIWRVYWQWWVPFYKVHN